MKRPTRMLIGGLFLLATSGGAWAHQGREPAGFLAGLLHPLTGLDHLLAMLAIGLWAGWWRGVSAAPGRITLALPAAFIAGAALGTGLGFARAFGPALEIAVAASLLPLGVVLALRWAGPLLPALALALICGTLHGGAHGLELARFGSAAAAAGFLLGTALLHATGVALALGLPRAHRARTATACGTGLAATGLWLLA